MDRALFTATAAVLVDADLATYLADKCINAIPSSQRDLAQIRLELRNFHDRLSQLQESNVPKSLQPTLISVVTSCSGICKRIGDILAGCGEDADPVRCWALVSAPTELRQLRQEIVQGRRTVDIVHRALTSIYHDSLLLSDMDDLKRALDTGASPSNTSIVSCLDAVETYIAQNGAASKSSQDLTISESPPPIQDIMMSFRRSSLRDWETRDSAICAMEDFNDTRDFDTTGHDSPPGTREDEKNEPFKPNETTLDSQDLRPPPLKIKPKDPRRGSRSSPIYTLFPPASAPPVKALPPVPPPRSPRRPVTNPLPAFSERIADVTIPNPIQTRQRRASSGLKNEAHISSTDSFSNRFSGSSKGSVVPVRPSSYGSQLRSFGSPRPGTVSEFGLTELEIIPLRRLETEDKEAFHGGIYSIDTSANSSVLASRHGKFHIRMWDLESHSLLTTIKVPFYVQIQPRSRDYFIRSHAILSETQNLIAISVTFGQNIEIWNWSKRKKLQTIHNALRWTAVRSDVYESCNFPLATYKEDDNIIKLYPMSLKKKPFGKPRLIDLHKAGLPHLPKMPELAFSPTGPLLIAAAGPRPPRPGNPPPVHTALLMAWQLDGGGGGDDDDDQVTHTPYKFFEATNHPELENSLPLHLATYGSVAVSIWEPAKFRTIGRPGLWQVEPVTITERVVLIWDFSASVDKSTTYSIPAVLACISPDCRFVAYCDPGGRPGGDDEAGALVVLDITETSGRELWRLDGYAMGGDKRMMMTMTAESGWRSNRWSRKSSDTRRSGHRSASDRSSEIFGGVEGLELLAQNLRKVTELTFSGDGSRLLVGDGDGEIGIYEFRLDGLHRTFSADSV